MRFYDRLTCTGVPTRLLDIPKTDWASGLLYGPAGVGKSYRAAAMLPADGVWVNVSRYLDDCRWAATVQLDDEGDLEAWRALKWLEAMPGLAVPMVLDDVAVEKPSEFSISRLYNLLEARWSELLPTVVTSNLGPDGLAELLGDRITSRILGLGRPVRMLGDDRRLAWN